MIMNRHMPSLLSLIQIFARTKSSHSRVENHSFTDVFSNDTIGGIKNISYDSIIVNWCAFGSRRLTVQFTCIHSTRVLNATSCNLEQVR